jgi:hypothetical protein
MEFSAYKIIDETDANQKYKYRITFDQKALPVAQFLNSSDYNMQVDSPNTGVSSDSTAAVKQTMETATQKAATETQKVPQADASKKTEDTKPAPKTERNQTPTAPRKTDPQYNHYYERIK